MRQSHRHAVPATPGTSAPSRHRTGVPDCAGGRARAFRLVSDGVAAGLPVPWRITLIHGHRRLTINVADRAEWESWRAHLGCGDVSVRVYDSEGPVRRSSTAATVRDGCRVAVDLVEDIDTWAVRMSVLEPEASS